MVVYWGFEKEDKSTTITWFMETLIAIFRYKTLVPRHFPFLFHLTLWCVESAAACRPPILSGYDLRYSGLAGWMVDCSPTCQLPFFFLRLCWIRTLRCSQSHARAERFYPQSQAREAAQSELNQTQTWTKARTLRRAYLGFRV